MRYPKVIYLIHEAFDTADMMWSEDPAPEKGMDEDDAVKYIRADTIPPIFTCKRCGWMGYGKFEQCINCWLPVVQRDEL